ncbi:MAG: GNAT family N-acetyltransferase [Pseudonocardia sp.]|nr:GNAT family N-acetyltransferase [Pseudonocardia sp.]
MTTETIAATVHRAWAADLSPAQLYLLLRLREEVFVVEQECAYPELDGRDLEEAARHYWLTPHGLPHTVLGCLRLLEEPGGAYRIGRLCTAPSVRRRGLGRQLLRAGLAEVGGGACVLDAQEHLVEFYRKHGFEPSGPSYVEDGIAHVPMVRGGTRAPRR